MSTFDESLKALDKAQDAIEVAEYDLKGNYILAATNRAYYAYFYCMTAMLLTKNIYSKTHQGIQSKFSELFVKSGTFSPSVAVGIKNAFNLRQEADYDLDTTITAEVAKDTIEQAKEFYYLCKAYLRTLSAQ